MKIIAITTVISLFICTASFAQTQADDILGQYWTEKKEGKIEIFKKGNKYYGKILWRKKDKKDEKNPDKNLRDRSVIGITFLKDFVFEKEKWVDGDVYSIDNGNTYSGKIWLEDNGKTLKMRGYLGFSFIGKTATLTRVD